MHPKAPPAAMSTTPWEGELPARLGQAFGEGILEFLAYLGQNFLIAVPDSVIPILEYLQLEEEFDYLVDVTAVDYPNREDRFDLVYILYSFSSNQRIRVKTRISDGYKPQTASRRSPDRKLAGARGLRHVRNRIRRPSGHAAHPAAGRVGRLPAAQGLSTSSKWTIAGCRRTWASKADSNARRKQPFSTPPNWSSTWVRSTRPRTACCA